MNGTTVAVILVVVGLGAVGIYFLTRSTSPGSKPGATQTNSGNQFLDQISKQTGVPVKEIGQAAANSPLWLKASMFPVGVTGEAYKLVTDPKGVYNDVKGVASGAWDKITSIF
jgi:hypothetical protein